MVRNKAVNKSGPGINSGFNRTRSGAQKGPIPKPTDPCSTAPITTMPKVTIISIKLRGNSINNNQYFPVLIKNTIIKNVLYE